MLIPTYTILVNDSNNINDLSNLFLYSNITLFTHINFIEEQLCDLNGQVH